MVVDTVSVAVAEDVRRRGELESCSGHGSGSGEEGDLGREPAQGSAVWVGVWP